MVEKPHLRGKERRDTHATSYTDILGNISTHVISVLMPGIGKVRRILNQEHERVEIPRNTIHTTQL